MDKVRLGIIGAGGMGSAHARYLRAGAVKRCELTAVCDIDPERLAPFTDINTYTKSAAMIRSGDVDAVLIATPHYDHTTIGIDAFRNGLHVLVEKPISVHKADCERLIAAHEAGDQVFGAMFQMRTHAAYRKIKGLLDAGELGRIQRTNWIVTAWFRTEAYYASGGWRATWRGEGGGVLLNQCPHNLDLMQWFFGMPRRVTACCSFGKYHQIEVEDEVTAYLEYANGATGVFVASTGEAPGTDRLEITGDRGRLVYENGEIRFLRTEASVAEFRSTDPGSFSRPDTWEIRVPYGAERGEHQAVTQRFVEAILDGTPLVAPGQEGIRSVELANAMLFSSFTDKAVDLPLDAEAYEAHLKKLIEGSRFKKKTVKQGVTDISDSFR